MEINKENMVNALNKLIEHEKVNRYNTPYEDSKDITIYKEGYIRALRNLLFAVSVNGE